MKSVLIVETIILIISLLIVANIISHYFVSIPASLIQIVAGVIAALTLNVKISVNTEWFLLVFIAPILFNDGNRFPKRELWKLKGPIMGNAIVLVIVSTVVGGALVKFLMPSLPWATAFTLVAVLSPTDPIAVQSIAKKAKLPDKLMHLISGESLINDASGLICFKYAVAATVTGAFSLANATIDFFYIAIIGALVGAIMIWIFNGVRLYLINQGVDDSILHAIIQILIPFIIYYIAEDVFHVSGVVAVVIAGILNISSNRTGGAFSPEIRLVTSRTWDMLVYLLNGFVFVLLGIEIPFAMEELIHNQSMNTIKALGFAFIIWVMLTVIRFLWSYFYSTFFERSDRTDFNLFSKARFYYCLMSGISGVRGAVTMVAILSLPFVTNSGAAFPARTLLLFIASAVIIYSLIGATILIPLITKNTAPITYRGNAINTDDDVDVDDSSDGTEVVSTETNTLSAEQANRVVIEKTINKLREENKNGRDPVYTTVIAEYVFNLHNIQLQSDGPNPISKKRVKGKKDAELWDICLNCELEAIEELYASKDISEEAYQTSVKRIEKYKRGLVKHHYNQTIEFFLGYFRRTVKEISKVIHVPFTKREEVVQYNREAIKISIAGSRRALEKLRELEETDSEIAYDNLLYLFQRHYEERLELLQGRRRNHSEQFNIDKVNLEVNALSFQRAFVLDLLEQGRISRATANTLRKNINYSEEVINYDIQ